MKAKTKAGKMDQFLGSSLKEFRTKKNVSTKELASAADLTYQQIQKYESGHDRISAATLYIFSKYLKVPMKNFFPKDV